MGTLTRLTLCIGASTLFAGCGGSPTLSVPSAISRTHKSWMSPAAKSSNYLLYVSDEFSGEVDVYDYTTGTRVGELYDFGEPAGQCVDAKGDVYITDYYFGDVVEYAHGGSTPLRTLSTNNFPIGCAVNKSGDLAVSDFAGFNGTSVGAVCVWKGGSGSPACYQDVSACSYIWPPAYDNKGNLFVVGLSSQYESEVCGLLAGASRMVTLSFNGHIYYPSGTVWDGKYIALGDQEASGQYQTALYQVTLSGSTLTEVGEATLDDPSCGENAVVQPFVVGKKNTPVNRKRGKTVIGGNLKCASTGVLDFWHYAKGGNPYNHFDLGRGFVPDGESVSIQK